MVLAILLTTLMSSTTVGPSAVNEPCAGSPEYLLWARGTIVQAFTPNLLHSDYLSIPKGISGHSRIVSISPRPQQSTSSNDLVSRTTPW